MRVEQFLGVRAGQLGGGRRKLTGTVDIALLPSLARRDDIATLTQGYGHVIVDECHHLGARGVRTLGQTDRRAVLARPHRHTQPP
jgi:superfamily II DNA or RNA helicase